MVAGFRVGRTGRPAVGLSVGCLPSGLIQGTPSVPRARWIGISDLCFAKDGVPLPGSPRVRMGLAWCRFARRLRRHRRPACGFDVLLCVCRAVLGQVARTCAAGISAVSPCIGVCYDHSWRPRLREKPAFCTFCGDGLTLSHRRAVDADGVGNGAHRERVVALHRENMAPDHWRELSALSFQQSGVGRQLLAVSC